MCLHDENTHVICLPTSLLNHFVKEQVLVICLVQDQLYIIESCAFTHEGFPLKEPHGDPRPP